MYSTGRPRRRWSPGARLRAVVIVLAIVAAGIALVDHLLVPASPDRTKTSTQSLVQVLEGGGVRRVEIPAATVRVELKNGKILEAAVEPDRDVGPAIKHSGADLSIVRAAPAQTASPIAYIVNLLPFVIMLLVVVYAVRGLVRRSGRTP